MMTYPNEPTGDQCDRHEVIEWGDESTHNAGFACWYPQMGGYASRCVILPHGNGCLDAYIWHDGEFPFRSVDPEMHDGVRLPAVLHHCDAEQFIRFGQEVSKMMGDD